MSLPILPSSPATGARAARVARTLGAAAAMAAAGGVPGALAAQQTPAAAPAAGPCSGAAPTRGALRQEGSPRVLERAMIELHAVDARHAEGQGAAGGGARTPRPGTNVIRVFQPRGYLGVRTLEVSDIRLTPTGRVVRYCTYPVVVSVEPASPADRAGLEQGDTLVAYNDRDLVKSGEIELDRLLVPGETVRVSLRRDGRALTRPVVVGRPQVAGVFRAFVDGPGRERTTNVVMVTPDGAPLVLGASPEERRAIVGAIAPRAPARPLAAASGAPTPPGAPSAPRPTVMPTPAPGFVFSYSIGGPTPMLGAQLMTLDDDLREALGARDGGGVFVLRVAPRTEAFESGLRSGDIIRAANGQPVTNPLSIQRALATANRVTPAGGGEERALRLEIERKGQRKVVTLRW